MHVIWFVLILTTGSFILCVTGNCDFCILFKELFVLVLFLTIGFFTFVISFYLTFRNSTEKVTVATILAILILISYFLLKNNIHSFHINFPKCEISHTGRAK